MARSSLAWAGSPVALWPLDDVGTFTPWVGAALPPAELIRFFLFDYTAGNPGRNEFAPGREQDG